MRYIIPVSLVVIFLLAPSVLIKARDIDAPAISAGDTVSKIDGTATENQPSKAGTVKDDGDANRKSENIIPPKTDEAQTSDLVPRLMGLMEAGIDWVLWLLFGLGAICLFLFIERTIYFLIYAGGVARARETLCEHLSQGDLKRAHDYFKGRREIAARIITEAISNGGCAPEAVAEMIDGRLIVERQRLERGLSVVGTIGSNAPFIGLFGTVLGIIKAFHDLSIAQQAGPAVVMSGISEALVATAIGLLVAIPAVVVFNVFKARSRSVIAGAESVFKLYLSHQLNICLGGMEKYSSHQPQLEGGAFESESLHEI